MREVKDSYPSAREVAKLGVVRPPLVYLISGHTSPYRLASKDKMPISSPLCSGNRIPDLSEGVTPKDLSCRFLPRDQRPTCECYAHRHCLLDLTTSSGSSPFAAE